MGLFFSLLSPFCVPAWFTEQFFFFHAGHLWTLFTHEEGHQGLKLKVICSLLLPATDWGHLPLCVSFCPISTSLSIQLDRNARASVLSQEEGVVRGSMKMLVPRCSFEGMKWVSWEDSPHLSAGIALCCHSVFYYILAWKITPGGY